MTHADRPRFAELLLALAETFDETVSDVRAEIYFNALSPYSLAQVDAAIVTAARSQKFFPKPAEIIAFIEGDADDDAEIAWMDVCRQVRKVGYYGTPTLRPAVHRAVANVFGGWREMCSKLPADGPEFLGWANRFKAAYLVFRKHDHPAITLPNAPDLRRLLS